MNLTNYGEYLNKYKKYLEELANTSKFCKN